MNEPSVFLAPITVDDGHVLAEVFCACGCPSDTTHRLFGTYEEALAFAADTFATPRVVFISYDLTIDDTLTQVLVGAPE